MVTKIGSTYWGYWANRYKYF